MSGNDKRVSIIGCGWIGLPLAKALLNEGYTVRGTSTRSERLKVLEQTGIHACLYPSLNPDPELVRPDVLVLTFPPNRRLENPASPYLEQMHTILNLLRIDQLNGIVFLSSTGVYGSSEKVVTEEDIPKPNRKTAEALLKAEQFWTAHAAAKLTVLRLAGLVGPGRQPGRFLANRKHILGGANPVNLVHQLDVIRAILLIIRRAAWGTVFNVCADQHPTKKEVYSESAIRLGLPPPIFNDNLKTSHKLVSNQKLKDELSFTFLYPDPLQFPADTS